MLFVWVAAGLAGGLLVNYLADVLPSTRTLSRPIWWPINGLKFRVYLARLRVIAVIVLSAGAVGLIYQHPSPDFPLLFLEIIILYFLLVAVIDIEYRVVMHPVSLAGVILLGAIGLTRHSILDTVLGGLAGFGFMLALYFLGDWLGRLMARARNEKWEDTALGFGDVNLAGVIGLLTGWPGVIIALFAGMVAAAIFSAAYLLWMVINRKYSAFSSIPYAPFLCLGAVLTVITGVYGLIGG
ncbi:MAG: A24 family peptidase [Anaerolineales bacterium]